MKKIAKILLAVLLITTGKSYSQHVYQIRADSVRIYNVCDTAELIIENRTRGVAGYLYNKGNGRTEFRRIRLETVGNNQIAITGQDTLNLSSLSGIGGVDTIYRSGDNILYVKKGVTYTINAPIVQAGNFVQNQFTSVQGGNAWLSGIIRANNRLDVPKDGSNTFAVATTPHLLLQNAAGSRGAGLQLNGDTNPGLAAWVNDGTSWMKRFEIFSNGSVQFPNILSGNATGVNTTGTLQIGNIPAQGTAAAAFLTHSSGMVQTRTPAQVLSDIGALNAAAGDARYPQLSGSYANPSWLTSLAWGKITGAPASFPTSSNLQGVTDNGSTTTNSMLISPGNNTFRYLGIQRTVSGVISQAQLAHNGNTSIAWTPDVSAPTVTYRVDIAPNLLNYYNNGAIETIWRSGNHPAGVANNTAVLTGATVYSNIVTNSAGHLTAVTTRALAPSDIGAIRSTAPSNTNWNTFNGSTTAAFNESNTNGPTGVAYFGLNMPSLDANFGAQLAFRSGTGYFRTLEAGTYGSWLQIADRAWVSGNFVPSSGSGNYLQNTSAMQPASNFWISGQGVTNGNFQVRQNGSNAIAGALTLYNTGATRGVNFQLNGDTDPGLALWINSGGTWNKRVEFFSNGLAQFYSNVTLSNAASTLNVAGNTVMSGTLDLNNVPSLATAATNFLTHNGGIVSSRTPFQVLSDIGGAPSSGSGSYIQNQYLGEQTASIRIDGPIRTTGSAAEIMVWKNGSNAVSPFLHLRNIANTRGVNFQLNGDANPGLSTWVHNGTAWMERQRLNATDGSTTFIGEGGEGINLTRALNVISSATAGLRFNAHNASSAVVTYGQIWGIIGGTAAGAEHGHLAFNTRNAGVVGEKMRLTNTGNLLIGTLTDDSSNKLQVQGSIKASIPALATAGTLFLTSNSGVISSRTAAQLLSDIGAAPASGSGNYLFNQFASAQTADAWITGTLRADARMYSPEILGVGAGGASVIGNASAGALQLLGGATGATSNRGGQINLYGGSHTTGLGAITFHTGSGTGGTLQPERMRINPAGAVGIGTASPQFDLHVQSAATNGMAIQNTIAMSPTSGAFLRMYNSGLPSAADQRLGGMLWGANTTGSTYVTGAQVQAAAEGAWTSGTSYPTYLSFQTVSSGTALSEKLRLNATGMVVSGNARINGGSINVPAGHVTLGGAGVTAAYNVDIIRSVSSVNYTARLGVGRQDRPCLQPQTAQRPPIKAFT